MSLILIQQMSPIFEVLLGVMICRVLRIETKHSPILKELLTQKFLLNQSVCGKAVCVRKI